MFSLKFFKKKSKAPAPEVLDTKPAPAAPESTPEKVEPASPEICPENTPAPAPVLPPPPEPSYEEKLMAAYRGELIKQRRAFKDTDTMRDLILMLRPGFNEKQWMEFHKRVKEGY